MCPTIKELSCIRKASLFFMKSLLQAFKMALKLYTHIFEHLLCNKNCYIGYIRNGGMDFFGIIFQRYEIARQSVYQWEERK